MAGRPCEACRHAERQQLETAILAGGSFRNIGQRFDLSAAAVFRHRESHMAEQVAAAAEARAAELATPSPPTTPPLPSTTPSSAEPPERSRREQTADALDIVAQLRAINGAALTVLRDARVAGDGRLVLSACDRVLRQLELQAKLIGAIDERPTVNVFVTPDWLALEAVLVAVLGRFPDARAAVVERLQDLRAS